LYSVSSGNVKFTSDAPLELIQASTDNINGLVRSEDRSFAFRVDMKSFRGFNSDLQRTHFNENYLETGKYPYTTFEGKIIEEISFFQPGSHEVRGKGKFTCHGISQERIIKCKLDISPDKLTVNTDFSVFLTDHDIKVPSVVRQKIAEEIFVDVEIELTPRK
jgi:polyisoprenoid-binding protein YceI